MGKAVGKLFSSRKVRVVIVGEDGAGKTSLLHNLDLGTITDTYTDDFETIEALSGDQVQAVAWGMFGSRCAGSKLTYYSKIDAFIYILNDREPLDHPDEYVGPCPSPLYYLNGGRFTHSIVAVAVNQRRAGKGTPMTLEEVRSGLDLDNTHTYKLFPIVATTGEGVDKLQDWLSQELGKKLTRQWFFGSADQQQIKKRDTSSFHTRILSSFKDLFTRI